MKSHGQIGYEAYRNFTGGISLATGQQIPEWDKLKPEFQNAWDAAGEAIATRSAAAIQGLHEVDECARSPLE